MKLFLVMHYGRYHTPDTIHADTQGQSSIVFAMAHMLGIKLMPRIRNWKNINLFKASADETYNNIDSLFNGTINWDIIETHWQDTQIDRLNF